MNDDFLSLNEFILSALLHDIGKAMQRAELPYSKQFDDRAKNNFGHSTHLHSIWTEQFFADNIPDWAKDNPHWQRITNLAASHHLDSVVNNQDMVLLKILKTADGLASSYDRDDINEKSEYKKKPLYSVFDEIRLDSKQNIDYTYTLPFKPLIPENIFPEKKTKNTESKVEDYKKLFTDFDAEYQNLLKKWSLESELPQFLSATDYLLQKYFWSVPSNTQEPHPTNSLYHHSRLTASISAVIYQQLKLSGFDENELKNIHHQKAFMLIAGDLNGIQNYLFDLNPEKASKGAKFLRARSFKIKALSDMIIHKIIYSLNLSYHNILINAGGKFVLFAPNNQEISNKLQELKKTIESYFYHETLGSLSLNLDWQLKISLDELDKNHLDNTLKSLFTNLEIIKRQKFFHQLKNEQEQWNPDSFIIKDYKLVNDQLCEHCHKRTTHNNDTVCTHCDAEQRLGKDLPKKQFAAICIKEIDDTSFNEYIKLDNTYFYLLKNKDDVNSFINYAQKNSLDYFIYTYKRNNDSFYSVFPFKPTAAYIPTDDYNDPLDMETIAQKAKQKWTDKGEQGISANAVMKGDVDNLGQIFIKGLKANDIKLNLTRYVSLSSYFDFFFSDYIPYVIENSSVIFNSKEFHFNNIYVVYAGGDDFCLVGPWIEIFLFAEKIYNDFKAFTCSNPEISFSAGVELLHGKAPLKFNIDMAEDNLSKVKSEYHTLSENIDKKQKNALYLFETPIPWEDLDFIKSKAEKLLNFRLHSDENKGLTTQFIYKLLEFHESYMKIHFKKNKNIKSEELMRAYMYPAFLNYNIKNNLKPEYHQHIIDELQELMSSNAQKYMRYLKVILHIVIYALRK